ncbi:DEAD/DEAH box helicase [Piscinibacterium candidicorallinum]|uniref:DEAD/DEAH box helicase n=1 Tax=Piscinibacterium candidicorallinum TaxID=1793872 RepID=A0ABV7GZZ8_9BURK
MADAIVLIERALRRIPSDSWKVFLASRYGSRLRESLSLVEQTLSGLGGAKRSRADIPSHLARTEGPGLMQDSVLGPWIREQWLRGCSTATWQRLLDRYNELSSSKTGSIRSDATQRGHAPETIAAYWHQGGAWARFFCAALRLPDAFWRRRDQLKVEDMEVLPGAPLPALHDFQVQAYDHLRLLLRSRARGRSALLSLPTGAGKTRVVVEAICDHLAKRLPESASSVLWIAHSAELQIQAWECFRAVWQVPPLRGAFEPIARFEPLSLVRLWGGRDPKSLPDAPAQPEVLIASIDQLASWSRRDPAALAQIRDRNLACVVIDEAHGAITAEFRGVLEALGVKASGKWLPEPSAPLLIGMTATPWRTDDTQDAALRRMFSRRLVTSRALGTSPVGTLQRRGILSEIDHIRLRVRNVPAMTPAQRRHVERFHEIPPEYLDRLGGSVDRNRQIVETLAAMRGAAKAIVFACSIAHAEILTACVERIRGPGTAIAITSATPRGSRSLAIEAFRRKDGGPSVLVTVGVLAAGFDAPKVDVVLIARPTMSATLYEQMAGRGLRGPANGGTKRCRLIDVQDEGLPDGVLSYARVMERWERSPRAITKRGIG